MELDFAPGGVMVDGEFCRLPLAAQLVFSLAVKHWDATQKTPAAHLFDWEPLAAALPGPGQSAGTSGPTDR
jgi:hypothetical protein